MHATQSIAIKWSKQPIECATQKHLFWFFYLSGWYMDDIIEYNACFWVLQAMEVNMPPLFIPCISSRSAIFTVHWVWLSLSNWSDNSHQLITLDERFVNWVDYEHQDDAETNSESKWKAVRKFIICPLLHRVSIRLPLLQQYKPCKPHPIPVFTLYYTCITLYYRVKPGGFRLVLNPPGFALKTCHWNCLVYINTSRQLFICKVLCLLGRLSFLESTLSFPGQDGKLPSCKTTSKLVWQCGCQAKVCHGQIERLQKKVAKWIIRESR